MRYLVTGGAGYLGSQVVRALVARGEDVVVVDDLSTGDIRRLRSVRERITFIAGDLGDPIVVSMAMRGCQGVFHFAALSGVPESFRDPRRNRHSGVIVTRNVVAAARRLGVTRVVYASSAAVYGELPGLPKDETSGVAPRSPYAMGKVEGESLLATLPGRGCDGVALRFFNVYGDETSGDYGRQDVVGTFAQRMLEQQPLTVFGTGFESRDFIHVSDAVRASLCAMDHPTPLGGVALVVATGRCTSLRELIAALERRMGRRAVVERRAPRVGDVRHLVGDASLAEELIGWRARVTLEEGLDALLAGRQSIPRPRRRNTLRMVGAFDGA